MSTPNSQNEDIAKRICMIRGQEGLSGRAIAKLYGVTAKSWLRWETGMSVIPSPVAVFLHRRFHISLSWLLTGQGPMKREDESTDNSNGSAPPVDGNAQCFYKTTGRYPSGRSQVDLDDQQARVDAVNAMLQHIGHGPITIHPHLRLALLQATITDNLTVDAARTLINAALRDDRDRWQTAHQDKEPPPIPELAPTTTDNKDDQIPSSGKQWF